MWPRWSTGLIACQRGVLPSSCRLGCCSFFFRMVSLLKWAVAAHVWNVWVPLGDCCATGQCGKIGASKQAFLKDFCGR
jgi:hypothetical protein